MTRTMMRLTDTAESMMSFSGTLKVISPSTITQI
jgi:hypothetical protein